MARFVIRGSASVDAEPDAEGHYVWLTRDGVKVFGGCWADCVREAHRLGRAGDTLTSGTVPPFIGQPIEESRRWWTGD